MLNICGFLTIEIVSFRGNIKTKLIYFYIRNPGMERMALIKATLTPWCSP
jgi:hypothetical protein